MRMSRPLGLFAAAGLTLAALVAPVSTATAADAFTVTTLHFKVKVGPTNDHHVRHRRRPLRAEHRLRRQPRPGAS